MTRASVVAACLAWTWALSGCASIPETHHYAIPAPPGPSTPALPDGPVLTVDELEIDAAYDDPRMVYRPDRFRLSYYNYHHWSGEPSEVLSDYIRQSLARSGLFRMVTRTLRPDTTLVLTGRITALEEVDVTETEWQAHVALELHLEDPRTGATLWSRTFEVREPLGRQSPAGVAAGVTAALERIMAATLPHVARVAKRHDDREVFGAVDESVE